ncbi:ABC transporter substrate-binding protein [Pseudomonadota bacterium]|nr:ABC transporter substrate-binding protein [Pseudomonadota bacterium]
MTKYNLTTILVTLCLLFNARIILSDANIKVGMSAALTGPSATLGNDLRVGIESYFKLVNDRGGVQNRLLEFIVRDDGYEPERAASNMRTLINNDGVLAVIGNIGTPTAIVTAPIAKSKKTLLFGALSGGDVLREKPASRYIINYRPSYAEEMTEIINGLLQVGFKPDDIAFFTQRDGFGDAVYHGAIDAFNQHGYTFLDSLIHGRYTRNTLNVEDAVVSILDAAIAPKIVIMGASYAPSAKFIKLLQSELPETWFINVSFVGSHSLNRVLGDISNQVVVTQVVPELSAQLPIIEEYTNALKKFDTNLIPNEVSLEGFIIAKIFHEGLVAVKGEINKESIIIGIESLKGLDLGIDVNISYDEVEHQAMHKVWLTRFENGIIKPFNWNILLEDE